MIVARMSGSRGTSEKGRACRKKGMEFREKEFGNKSKNASFFFFLENILKKKIN
jgi:hypothetical protein